MDTGAVWTVVGTGLGATWAAVRAGISITFEFAAVVISALVPADVTGVDVGADGTGDGSGAGTGNDEEKLRADTSSLIYTKISCY